MRILFLTQWFDPESTFKGLVFVKEFARRGHEVQVLTGFPNYPGGKIYPGYKVKPFQKEIMDGIEVIRVALYPSHDDSRIGRVMNYLSFSLSAAIGGALLVRKADVMYVYHPPATVGLSARFIGFFRRIPYVYDIQDLWPDTLTSTGMVNNQLIIRMVHAICKGVYRQAAHIAVLSPGFRSELIKRGVPDNKISVVYNWCDEQFFLNIPETQDFPEKQRFVDRFNIVFAGNMGKAQALETVLAAAKILAKTHTRIQFVFVGGGIDLAKLQNMTDSQKIANVLFLPKRPARGIGCILKAADVLLVHLKDDPLFQITIPSKIQAYLAAGRPLLVAVRGDAAELVKQAGAGIVCHPEDVDGLVEAAVQMASLPKAELLRLGERGRLYYERNLSLASGVKRFDAIFKKVFA